MMTFPYIDMTATGANLKSLLKKNGYTPASLQKTLGLGTVQAVYKWMQGVTLPSTDNLMALAWLFNVRIEDLLVCTVPGAQHVAA
jgi:transcriptional regulator with XRE-family HTH domain